MKRILIMSLAGATAIAGFAETAPRASASEAPAPARSIEQVRGEALAAMKSGDLQEVRWRGRHGWRGGHRWRGRGWRGGRHYRHRGHGGAVAAGIAGFAAGAIIAGSAARAERRGGGGKDWCASRYRSYDRRSGTYLGYDGDRHACP